MFGIVMTREPFAFYFVLFFLLMLGMTQFLLALLVGVGYGPRTTHDAGHPLKITVWVRMRTLPEEGACVVGAIQAQAPFLVMPSSEGPT
jgi:nitric oxide reductase large subunit